MLHGTMMSVLGRVQERPDDDVQEALLRAIPVLASYHHYGGSARSDSYRYESRSEWAVLH